jgi:hypothetical protein
MSDREDPGPGTWRKPEASDHRSPCPGLNALANHGHLPREGVVTTEQLVEALDRCLGLAPSIGTRLAEGAMAELGKRGADGVKRLDLADLGKHGFIEHDASLTRRDARHGDAVKLFEPLLEQLLSLSQDGRSLTLDDMAVAHRLRVAQSGSDGHAVPAKGVTLGALEAALLFAVLERDGAVSLDDARSFLKDEKLPADLPRRRLGWGALLSAVARLTAAGHFLDAAKRAKQAARDLPDPSRTCPVTGSSSPEKAGARARDGGGDAA